MWAQIAVIAWAQFRIMRNHLPRTDAGTVLLWLIAALWYGMYAALGTFLAIAIPSVPITEVRAYLPLGLLGVFLFWQIVPLFTLSTGWSLQLNKLQAYPVGMNALFAIEVCLRLTTAPEMILVLAGTLIGLLRHQALVWYAPFFLVFYVPFNLFLTLAIRETLLQSFEHNRFRELFAALLISIAVLPQILIRAGFGRGAKPYLFAVANSGLTPWHATAFLSTAAFRLLPLLVVICWTVASWAFARWRFAKALAGYDETGSSAVRRQSLTATAKPSFSRSLARWSDRWFKDPLGALVQKEIETLLRIPRFRVIFGMACIFSVVVFLPFTFHRMRHGFMSSNFLPIVNLYGLLLLGDVLLWNIFGFDRQAVQIYFVTAVPFKTVLLAKNIAAVFFIVLQTMAVWLVAVVIRASLTPASVVSAWLASAVVGLFFLSAGNLISVAIPRPMDPTQTFRKQAGGKMQLWLLLCTIGMFILMGAAYLAKWAFQSNWALLAVLAVELAIGLIFYYVSIDSAAERGVRDRERIVQTLAKGAAPVGM